MFKQIKITQEPTIAIHLFRQKYSVPHSKPNRGFSIGYNFNVLIDRYRYWNNIFKELSLLCVKYNYTMTSTESSYLLHPTLRIRCSMYLYCMSIAVNYEITVNTHGEFKQSVKEKFIFQRLSMPHCRSINKKLKICECV